MDVAAVIAETLSTWVDVPDPATPAAISNLAVNAPIQLPVEYLELLRLHDGGEGELGADPGWFQLWSTAEVLEYNRAYGVTENLHGFFGFGSNGGGEMLAFDSRDRQPWPVVMVTFIGMSADEALPVAADFAEFIRLLGRKHPEPETDTW